MKVFSLFLVALLAVLHHDFWWWNDAAPVAGFLPIGLAWHVFLSAVAGVVWTVICIIDWPDHLDEDDPSSPGSDSKGAQR